MCLRFAIIKYQETRVLCVAVLFFVSKTDSQLLPEAKQILELGFVLASVYKYQAAFFQRM